jgi:hypothetical protein
MLRLRHTSHPTRSVQPRWCLPAQTPDMRKREEKRDNHFFFPFGFEPLPAVDDTLAAREFDTDDALLPALDLTFLICLFWRHVLVQSPFRQESSTYHNAILGLLL